MKYLIATELFFPSIGGQQSRLKLLANSLSELGHKVEVICIGHTSELSDKEIVDKISVRRITHSKNYAKPKLKFLKRDWIAILKYSLKLKKILKNETYDYVILNQWPILHCFFIPKKILEVCVLDWCESRSSIIFKILQKLLSSRFKYNSSVSSHVANKINPGKSNSFIIFPSSSSKKISISVNEKDNKICMVSRIEKHKNIKLGIDIFNCIKKYNPDISMDIVGDGSCLEDIQKYIKQNSFKDISVLGYLNENDKNAILRDSKIIIIPSYREGHPVALSESVAFRTPVLTIDYKNNGTADIVNEYEIGKVISRRTENIETNTIFAFKEIIDNYSFYQKNCERATTLFDPIHNAKKFQNINGTRSRT